MWQRVRVKIDPAGIASLAGRVDAARAASIRAGLADVLGDQPVALEAAVLLSTCYPAIGAQLTSHPEDARRLAEGWDRPRTRRALDAELARGHRPGDTYESLRKELRAFARRERSRVALREVLPRRLGGADVDVTARELSVLADTTIDAAVREAIAWAAQRFGRPLDEQGREIGFVVLGMGKLGGEELNAGSDVDLIYFYATDDGAVVPTEPGGGGGDVSIELSEYFQRVARRVTATIEDITEDGQVWRVDLRLRPEGGSGPLAMSVAAAERYYESFGRTWERAALLRARPVAGDLSVGQTLLAALAPFVWRRRIDPTIATEMVSLVRRARTELARDPANDLKLGPGGIREAEFFVQTLQLVWGGKDPSLRIASTLPALARLEAKGLSTERESEDVSAGYLALRRVEHAVQSSSGIQTHELPRGADLERVARVLGFTGADRLVAHLDQRRSRIERRFLSLLPEGASHTQPWQAELAAIERGDGPALELLLGKALDLGGREPGADVASMARSLLALGRHPDSALGTRTREAFPGLDVELLDALSEAADPVQAALYLRVFFDRVRQPAVYVRLVFADTAALRRLTGIVGASAFIGDALANNPELGDLVLFTRDVVTPAFARNEVLSCPERISPADDPDEALVGALRLAKTRLTLEVALADVDGRLEPRGVSQVLSAVADASLEVAVRRALGSDTPAGLAVVAMGKLGGSEISYGSDLDVIFVYEPERAPDPLDAASFFTRAARKVIRYISTIHGAGPGYEIDARLRPSGNQGLLVTSLEAFARYHGMPGGDAAGAASSGARAAVWERMALIRARFSAGDSELGARAVSVARSAAFDAPVDAVTLAAELRRIRQRSLSEASRERAGVRDIKLGVGGLLDVEFVVQYLQLVHGPSLTEPARSVETFSALEGLIAGGVLDEARGRALLDAYQFLRRLELRVRVARADAAHVLEIDSPTLGALARRMGVRDHAARGAAESLLLRYDETAATVRGIFDDFLSA